MSKDKKVMYNEGWFVSANKMLRKMEVLAEEGWKLEKMTALKFIFKKAEKEDVKFAMDYREKVGNEEEYLEMFKVAGWSLVCQYEGFHIFKGNKDLPDINSDKELVEEFYSKEKSKAIKILIGSIIAITALFTISNIFNVNQLIDSILIILSLASVGIFGMYVVIVYSLFFRREK
jgi:Protein of unknown function (DUF2812)